MCAIHICFHSKSCLHVANRAQRLAYAAVITVKLSMSRCSSLSFASCQAEMSPCRVGDNMVMTCCDLVSGIASGHLTRWCTARYVKKVSKI